MAVFRRRACCGGWLIVRGSILGRVGLGCCRRSSVVILRLCRRIVLSMRWELFLRVCRCRGRELTRLVTFVLRLLLIVHSLCVWMTWRRLCVRSGRTLSGDGVPGWHWRCVWGRRRCRVLGGRLVILLIVVRRWRRIYDP